MRKNQVTITVHQVGDEIPMNKRVDSSTGEIVSARELVTYVDSDDVFEALSKAYSNIIEHISSERKVPSFGADDGVSVRIKAYYPKGFEPKGV